MESESKAEEVLKTTNFDLSDASLCGALALIEKEAGNLRTFKGTQQNLNREIGIILDLKGFEDTARLTTLLLKMRFGLHLKARQINNLLSPFLA